MKPEEYKGFMIADAPGWMFQATKIVPSAFFKHPLKACTIESLKIFVDSKLNRIRPKNRIKFVNEQVEM